MAKNAQLILRDKIYPVKANQTIRQALLEAGIQPHAVLATRDGELLTDDEVIREGQVIKLIAVISGG
ncbi:MAG: MoaD/ThiS family protein [Chloroflexota bacterium]